MILKLQAFAKTIHEFLFGRSSRELLFTAARLDRAALLKWLDTTEEGLLDREAEDRLAFLSRVQPGSLKAKVLRRDRKSVVPNDVAAVFRVHFAVNGPQWKEIPSNELASGDLVGLEEGDIVPADVRLLSCDDFHVDQSALTGDASAVRKYAGIGEGRDLPDLPNIALSGVKVAKGAALAVVVSGGPVRAKSEHFRRESRNISAYGFLVPQR